MRGRKRIHDRPVARTITIEAWMEDLIEESKKFGIKPIDIIYAGLLSIFKPENKLPPALIKAFIEHAGPKAEDLTDVVEYYKKELQTLETLPPTEQRKELVEMTPRAEKWFEAFHAVKFLETGDCFLIDKSAYQKEPGLFELQDDNPDIDWKKLPKFYAIEAVKKVHSQNGSPKGDVPA